MTDLYILVGHETKKVDDATDWSGQYNMADRVVGKTDVDGHVVSTVFLGLDHAFGDGPPMLFETMVFGASERDGDMRRYTTWEEAEALPELATPTAPKGERA